jgi:hypothetical protein
VKILTTGVYTQFQLPISYEPTFQNGKGAKLATHSALSLHHLAGPGSFPEHISYLF